MVINDTLTFITVILSIGFCIFPHNFTFQGDLKWKGMLINKSAEKQDVEQALSSLSSEAIVEDPK